LDPLTIKVGSPGRLDHPNGTQSGDRDHPLLRSQTMPLRLADAEDPLLEPLIARELKRARFDASWGPTIRQLATGEMKASTLRCCGSGCRPCVNEIKACTAAVLTSIQDPDAARAELDGGKGGLLKRGLRRVARGARRRLLD
jgi:hypothetical protein